MKDILYYVVPKESLISKGRWFFKGEKYPVYKISDGVVLVAENGEFNFTEDLFKKVINAWDLKVVKG